MRLPCRATPRANADEIHTKSAGRVGDDLHVHALGLEFRPSSGAGRGPMPGTDDETLAELTVLAGNDDDLAAQSTRLTNRLRDALLHIHPALERMLGPRPCPARSSSRSTLNPSSPPPPPRSVASSSGSPPNCGKSAPSATPLTVELESLLEAHPLAEVLTSMPGLGFRTALKILTTVGDGAAFPIGAHLAAYASHRSPDDPDLDQGETRVQRGIHALKSALFLSAFASLADPTNRAYYDRK